MDVEDWGQSTLDHTLEVTGRVVTNTHEILAMMERAGTRATFFVLGLVAERFPSLVREIRDAGHEVASHGTSHQSVAGLGPQRFREDLRRSIRVLEDALGERILGYRAPDFSISEEGLWALEILAEEGLRYDSSIFPFRGPRYGIGRAFRQPFLIRCKANPRFVEFPLATYQLPGARIPVGGGGYFRVLPYAVSRGALRSLNRSIGVATFYFHPYEIDAEEIRRLGDGVPAWIRIWQGLGRGRVRSRLGALLSDFRWSSVREHLEEEGLFAGRWLDLAASPSGAPRWEGP